MALAASFRTKNENNFCALRTVKEMHPLFPHSLKYNHLDVQISQIYFWNGNQHVSDSFFLHHQDSSTEHTACHTSYADCLLASSQHNLYEIHHCCVYSVRLLMMDGDTAETCRNLFQKYYLRNLCLSLVLL